MAHASKALLAPSEKIFYELDRLLEQSTRVDTIYRAYMKEISDSFRVSRVSLMLVDEARRELFIHQAEGIRPKIKSATRVRVGEGISGWVAEKGEPLLVRDIDRNRQFRKEKKGKGFKSPSFICVPLKVRGRVYGVLNVAEKQGAKGFSVDELKKLEAFGMQLAIVVENDKLRKQIEWLEHRPMDEIAEASHDFRIPLTCVQEVLHIMANEDLGPLTDHQREFLDLAKRNVKRMMRTFDHLIEIAQHVGPVKIKAEKVEVGRVLEELAQDFEARARRKRVHIEVSRPLKPVWVTTDGNRLHEIVMNLLDNAMKFTREGTDVWMRHKQVNGKCRIEVQDAGPGVNAKIRGTLFDKSAGLRRARAQGTQTGHGLGLAICYDMVQSLGGKIGFRSKPREGATFYIDLPLKTAGHQKKKRG